MPTLTITASTFEFDARPYSEAFNKATQQLFREAARAFYRAAIAKIPIRTGFVRGAFGVLGDLIGETNRGVGGGLKRLRKLHEVKKKIEHLEQTIKKVKEYESGAVKHQRRMERLSETVRTGVTEADVEMSSKEARIKHRGRRAKTDSASGEDSLDQLRMKTTMENRGSSRGKRGGFEKDEQDLNPEWRKYLSGEAVPEKIRRSIEYHVNHNESIYTREQVGEYEEHRRAIYEHLRSETEATINRTAEYKRRREKLEARVAGLKSRASNLTDKIKDTSTSAKRGTLAVFEALREKAHIERTVTFQDKEQVATPKKQRSLLEVLREKREGKKATTAEVTKISAKQLRREYLRTRRDEILGVKPGLKPSDQRYFRWKYAQRRAEQGLRPIEFYHLPDKKSVILKTISSGRNFASASLPGSEPFKKAALGTSGYLNDPNPDPKKRVDIFPEPRGNFLVGKLKESALKLSSTISIPSRLEFRFSVDISYFNIADTNSTRYNPSAPWQAMQAGKLAFQNYMTSNYAKIPSIVSFLLETEWTLHKDGTITKREKRIV